MLPIMKFISLSARVQRSINLNSPKLIQSMSKLTNDIILSKHDKATKIARQQQRSSLNFIFSFPARDLHRIRLKCVPGDVKCKKKKRRSVEQWWSTALWDNQTATIHIPKKSKHSPEENLQPDKRKIDLNQFRNRPNDLDNYPTNTQHFQSNPNSIEI